MGHIESGLIRVMMKHFTLGIDITIRSTGDDLTSFQKFFAKLTFRGGSCLLPFLSHGHKMMTFPFATFQTSRDCYYFASGDNEP